MARVASKMHTGERTAGMWAMETQERFFHMRPAYPAKERGFILHQRKSTNQQNGICILEESGFCSTAETNTTL